MKGFSLVEVMISMVIGLVILSALASYSMTTVTQVRTLERHVRLDRSLEAVFQELVREVRGMERAFWERYPLRNDLFEVDHQHAGILFRQRCVENETTSCITTWDIVPDGKEALVYQVFEHDYPLGLRLRPADETRPPGPEPAIQSMSVLLVVQASRAFPVLVKEVRSDIVDLVEAEYQPWSLPMSLQPIPTEVVLLGRLQVHHTRTGYAEGRNQHLVFQDLSVGPEGWAPTRSWSGHDFLEKMVWQSCNEAHGDRLLMIGQFERAKRLRRPKWIGGEPYDREVSHVALEL